MARATQPKGECAYCGHQTTKAAMTKHLSSCAPRKEAIEKADGKAGEKETLYHLRVQDAGQGQFWLDLEMRGSAMLKDLDHYLRAIWLECCGHMSEFSIGGWGGQKMGMTRRAAQAFAKGVELTHIYDFGTSSHTLIRAVGTREGRATTSRPISLMARNLMPESKCIECGEPAACLCLECLIEDDRWGTLCDAHAKTHPHGENYGEPLPLVNSPRLGMCGYTGPADPPY